MTEQTSMARRQEAAAPAQRAEDQVWSGSLTPSQKAAVARVAEEFGLNPYLGHIQVLGGKLYVGIDGWLEIANRHPKFDGYDLRALTREEKDAMLAGPDDVMFEAKVYRKDRRRPAVAFGRANRLNVNTEHKGSGQKLVVEVCQARALRKALRGAFSATELPLPDEGDGEDRAPAVTDAPERDYAPFWQAVKGLGVSNEEAHEVLGVESVKDVADLRAAYRRIEAHVQSKQLARSKPISQLEMLSGAYQLGYQDQADVLAALGVRSFGAWTRQGKGWADALRVLQAAVAARPIATLVPRAEPEPEDEDDADWPQDAEWHEAADEAELEPVATEPAPPQRPLTTRQQLFRRWEFAARGLADLGKPLRPLAEDLHDGELEGAVEEAERTLQTDMARRTPAR